MHVTLQTIEPKTTFYTLPSIDFLYQTFSFLFTVETKKSERIPEGLVKNLETALIILKSLKSFQGMTWKKYVGSDN